MTARVPYKERNPGTGHTPLPALASSWKTHSSPRAAEQPRLSPCLGLAASMVGSAMQWLVHGPCPVRGLGGGSEGTDNPSRVRQQVNHRELTFLSSDLVMRK